MKVHVEDDENNAKQEPFVVLLPLDPFPQPWYTNLCILMSGCNWKKVESELWKKKKKKKKKDLRSSSSSSTICYADK
jgi:hypothetical protein